MSFVQLLAGAVKLLNFLANYFRTEHIKQAGRNEQRLATTDKTNSILEKQRNEANTKNATPADLLDRMRDNNF